MNIIKCNHCRELLVGGIDTFGQYPDVLCRRCWYNCVHPQVAYWLLGDFLDPCYINDEQLKLLEVN